MGSRGAIVMGFFGGVFLALALAWQWQVSGPALVLPFLVSAAIAVSALRVLRRPGAGATLSSRARRALIWASTFEGIGIFVAINVVTNMGRPEWRLPAMALVVGLHFLPIAYGTAFRGFYLLGIALIAVALVGFGIASPLGGELAGIAAAGCLWSASMLGILRERRTASDENLTSLA